MELLAWRAPTNFEGRYSGATGGIAQHGMWKHVGLTSLRINSARHAKIDYTHIIYIYTYSIDIFFSSFFVR